MQYILVEFSDGIKAYQEIFNGNVLRYTDLDGNTIQDFCSCKVLNAEVTNPTWALPDPIISNTPTISTKLISKLAFLNRFTTTELANIYTVAKTNVVLEIWLKKFELSEQIDLYDKQTQEGLYSLEQFGLLNLGRAEEIINA